MPLSLKNQVFNKKIIIVTPWFGEFSGGAENLAKSLAAQLNKRGVNTLIFTTCCKSPYDDWWNDFYKEGVYQIGELQIYRFSTNKTRNIYQNVINKLTKNIQLTDHEKTDFFIAGINSDRLVSKLKHYINNNYEIIALPFFQGLTHSVINAYPNKVSLVPCFHDEPQFYWSNTQILLFNAKNIFYNSIEEKELTIKNYGSILGKKIIESPVTGIGIEIKSDTLSKKISIDLPEKYFVYLGKKDKGKNVDLLCHWFNIYIKNFDPKAKLIFIGGGDHALIPRIDNFIDLGFLPEEKKYYILKHAQALINLSPNESFSIVIMEGWLLGIPAIVYKGCSVTTEHCRRANAGIYIENELEFCLALEYLVKNREIAKMLGQNGKNYVKSNFTFDCVLNKYLQKLLN